MLTSSMTACIPWLPASAAAVLTLKSPRSVVLDVQAKKLPDSNPSAKIKSDEPGVFVAVGVDVAVGVNVLVGVSVGVGEGPNVLVAVAVAVSVGVGVGPVVLVAVGVGVIVGVFVAGGLVNVRLIASTSLPANPQVLPSKYKAGE